MSFVLLCGYQSFEANTGVSAPKRTHMLSVITVSQFPKVITPSRPKSPHARIVAGLYEIGYAVMFV